MFSGSTVFTVFLFQKSQIKQHIQLKFNKIVDVVNPKPVPLELDDELCNTVRDSIFRIFWEGLYSSFCKFLLNKSLNFRDCIRDRTLIESGL